MKFLLVGINSKYIHSNPAIYSLKAYADRTHPDTTFIREFTINNRIDAILEDIYGETPDAIGFSCYIWNISMIKQLIVELHKLLPDTDIFLGGPEVTFDAAAYLKKYPFLKGIFIGEGEVTYTELLDAYCKAGGSSSVDGSSSGGGSSSVSGSFFGGDSSSNGGSSSVDAIPGLLTSVSTLVPRSRTDFDDIPFFYSGANISDDFEHRIIYYESQRGCPFRCSYCLSSIDKDMRMRSLDKVMDELRFFLNSRVPQVKFIDRTFNCDAARTLEILKFLSENDNGVTNFHFEIAADILTEKEIDVLKKLRPGYVQLEIGIQTTNPETLKAINRPCNMEILRRNVSELLSNRNLHIHLDLIAGLPYEDMDSFINSFNDVYSMNPSQLQLGFLKVLKGTEIDLRSGEYGIKYTDEPPYEVLETNWITYSQIRVLKKVEEMVELYYNSAQFTTTVPMLCALFNTPYELYKALADYYETKGYFIMSPKRFKKYEILLEFAATIPGCDTEKIRSALTYDYYLRENPKSKPDFVHDVPTDVFDYVNRDPITGNATVLSVASVPDFV